MAGPSTDLRGTWFVVPTPFRLDDSLDHDSLGRLVEAAIGWGVDGLSVLGVTSEAAALTESERTAALDVVFETTARRVPVVVGCSGGSARVVAQRARDALVRGASAALVSAPPFAKDLEALPRFFSRVASDGGLPVVVQDDPASTAVAMSLEVLVESVRTSRARAVKLEHPPTPPKIARLMEAEPGLNVFGGLGGAFLLEELEAGACGSMTGFAFPETLRAVREAFEAGDRPGAGALFDRYRPLIEFEARPGIGLAIRKELLRRRGVIATAVTRFLLPPLDESTASELDEVLDRVDVAPGPNLLPMA